MMPQKSHNIRSRKFGLTELARAVCSLCGGAGPVEQDHDHRTDLCRGLLCSSCNHLVARFDRPVAEIQRFLDYLTLWEGRHADGGGRTYTDYMREVVPGYGVGARAPRPRTQRWQYPSRSESPATPEQAEARPLSHSASQSVHEG